MIKSCQQCETDFGITDADLKLYDKISPTIGGKKYNLPTPTLCPDCRQQRRIAHRNERKLYHRKCDLTGKEIISSYSSDKPLKVYDQEVYWSDQWDPLDYGLDFDFKRPFFVQMLELSQRTPRPCILNMSSENSLYTNHSAYNKNCYMCINTGYSEDLLYSSNYNLYNQNCTDCLAIQKCERCYFCVNTKNSAFSSYLYDCSNCNNCSFGYDLQGCNDCFGCYNLRHKQYCIFNVQYSKEAYLNKLPEIKPKTADEYSKMFQQFWDMVKQKAVHRDVNNFQCENSSGDHLFQNKNVRNSYYTFGSEDCAYAYDCGEVKNGIDVTEPFKGELQFETHACNQNYNAIVCSKCYENSNLMYSQYCWYSSDLFGCFGLKNKKYCILNKQYSKEEYEKLVPRIIEHMMKTGANGAQEWGQFFPYQLSPYSYNETTAQEYYPLVKEQALKLGSSWKEDDLTNRYQGPKVTIPALIQDVTDEITKQILTCKTCEKNYRIISQELKFYRQEGLPIPQYCPDCRHKTRMNLRNPRQLFERKCAQCGTTVKTSYAPNHPEKVFCEQCYLKVIY